MTARITPQGLLIMAWQPIIEKWTSQLRVPAISDLYRLTDIAPQTTLSHIFDQVDRSQKLKQFLSEACWCDVQAVHNRPRTASTETGTLLFPADESNPDRGGNLPAEYLLLEKCLWWPDPKVINDDDEFPGLRDFHIEYHLTARRHHRVSAKFLAAPAIGHTHEYSSTLEDSFGNMVNLPLRLSPEAATYPADRPTLPVTFTLLEILSAIYYAFGNVSKHLNLSQKEIAYREDGGNKRLDIFPGGDDEQLV